MIRRTIAFVALLALLFGPAVTPRADAYEAHVLSYSDGLDVSSLNPWFASSGNITALVELTAAEFFRFDAHGNPIPELATEVPTAANHGISKDGKSITYHLRHNVKWSDGQPFDSSDVLYSVAVGKNPGNNIFVRDPWDRLISASAPNKYTVVFHFKEPYATFISDYFSTQSGSAILPKHILGGSTLINTAAYNGLPVGIGPFRFTAYNRGSDVEMEANPYYWRGLPKLHKVIYKIITDDNTRLTELQSGELSLSDLINGTQVATAKAVPGKKNATRLSQFMGGLFFNVTHPAVSEAVVRRALRMATDRATSFDKVFLRNGRMTESVVPVITRNYLELPLTKYDPAAAAKMLDADGWKVGPDRIRHKNGVALNLDMAIPSGYQPSATLAAILKEDWAQINVGITIHTWSTSQFFAIYANGGIIQTGKFDVALFSQSMGPVFANINGVYDCAGAPPNGANASHYCNHKVDALDDRYLHSYDPKVQEAAATQFQRIIDEDAPAIILYDRAFFSVYDGRITGYHPHPFSYWGDPMELDI
ncbi:MAG TPA: peptide ABC transporter substrate-binding protein [Candidatus Baltobacteraceae bacterium]|jgi:peptide/nickel transport system substrate-binding protein